jgi:hypothetical protein
MYCPSCGTEVTLGLNYCNRCGANLSQASNLPEQLPVRQVSLTGPTIAIALMVIVGLGIIFASVADLAKNDFHPVALTWMVVAGLAMITGVAALVIRQWSYLAGVVKPKEQSLPRKKSAGKEPIVPAQLPPLRSEPVSSVTEHTTRTFEPAYIEREPRK